VAQECRKGGVGRPRSCVLRADWDRLIAELARRQAGRVSREQLLAAGVSRDGIKARLRSGRLIRLHPGVFALGHRSDARARHWAALLAVGDDGAISHMSAAAEHRMLKHAPVVVDVTTPRRLLSRNGVRVHVRALEPASLTAIEGLPLTSPAQTLFDLASMLGAAALVAAANEAFVQRLVTVDDLHAALGRNHRRKGSSGFRRMLARIDPEGRVIRSSLEARFNAFLRGRGYPPWESNVRIRIGDETIEPDVLWRRQRVVVEADGRDPHLAPLTFASDRRRDRRLRVEGWEPVRVTSVDLTDRPDELDADLRALLGLLPRR
jgi:predicted transcriptional regulator of viral defense system/very-short-patch-repair endonuclease